MDIEKRIELPPMEHLEQLASIGHQSQDRQKQPQKKRLSQLKGQTRVEKEEQISRMDEDGHIDYRA